MDADNDCPRDLAHSVSKRARKHISNRARSHATSIRVATVCANPEYEVWIVGSLSGEGGDRIRSHLEIRSGVLPPCDIESLRDAKGWLSTQMPNTRKYRSTRDQARSTAHISLSDTHRLSRSFRRLCHAIEELIEAAHTEASGLIVTP